MKKTLLLAPLLLLVLFKSLSQNRSKDSKYPILISPYLIGQNFWERSSIPDVFNTLKSVKYESIRIGGNGYENAGFMYGAVNRAIDSTRELGAEPIVQIPRQLMKDNKAYEMIAYVNGKLNKRIKFWSIGNEPDHKNQLSSPEQVCDYFREISEQIKNYDQNAIVMGFDLASYSKVYLDRLLGGDLDVTGKIPGKSYYYLDIVTLHKYKFADISAIEDEVKALKSKLSVINLRRPIDKPIRWAITEFNTHWIVDKNGDEGYLPYTFHNGQIFAEIYDLGMREEAFTICPWSMIEGGADREGTDLSLFDLSDHHYFPRSNYWHTLMLSQNIKKHYLNHEDNKKDIIVIPMGDSTGTAVMILNKNQTNGYQYRLNLNYKKLQKKTDLIISIDANLSKNYTSRIESFSTQMLVFNSKGSLIKKYSYSNLNALKQEKPLIEEF